jgi:hypothetical protein
VLIARKNFKLVSGGARPLKQDLKLEVIKGTVSLLSASLTRHLKKTEGGMILQCIKVAQYKFWENELFAILVQKSSGNNESLFKSHH